MLLKASHSLYGFGESFEDEVTVEMHEGVMASYQNERKRVLGQFYLKINNVGAIGKRYGVAINQQSR